MDIPSDRQAGRPSRNRAATPQIAPGTLLGGRYEVTTVEAPSPFGTTYDAIDREAHHPVFVRHVNPDLLAHSSPQRLREELAAVAKLGHKNLAHILDFVAAPEGVFVVTDHVEGKSLRTFLAQRRQQTGGGLSLKSAVNVVAHVCNALSALHAVAPHGALWASNIYVNMAGRVKLLDFGLARVLPGFAPLSTPEDRAGVAPETLSGRTPNARTDIYALGAIFYELLAGRPPASGVARISAAVPGLPPEMDQAIARCLAPNPDDRPGDPQKIKQALWQLVEARGAAASQQLTVADIAQAARVSAQQPAAPPAALRIDDNEERWLISKGKLDFGPYSFAQVKDLIGKDDIVLGHILIDNDRGDRMPVEEHPLLHDLVMAAAQRREDQRRAHVEQQVVQQHARHGRAFFAVIGAAVIALGVGGYFVIRALGGSKKAARNDIAALDAAELKNFKVAGAKRVTGGKRHAGPRPAGGPADDEALAFDMDDDSVGDERLDDNQINQVIGANGGSLAKCLLEESHRGGSRSADIEFSVKGNGRVSFVRVNGETKSSLAACVYGRMSGWRFPTFNGARTRASFSMNL